MNINFKELEKKFPSTEIIDKVFEKFGYDTLAHGGNNFARDLNRCDEFFHDYPYDEYISYRYSHKWASAEKKLYPNGTNLHRLWIEYAFNPKDFEDSIEYLASLWNGENEKAEKLKSKIIDKVMKRRLGIKNIILASKSPRRAELLKKLCADFEIISGGAAEIETAENPAELAIKNATIKAETVAQDFLNDIVIGADTIVVLNGKIFGKPHGEQGAFDMLKTLSGKKHEVITGIAICTGGKTFTASEVTEVYFGEMTDEEISAYVATEEPLDKSGSYALQGGAAKFIQKINGDWSNVVGLPLYRLRILAKSVGINF